MPKPVTVHFEVNTKIVHNFDVISEVLRCGEMGEPAALTTFREVNPPAPWSRSHESRGCVASDWGPGQKGAGCEASSG